MQELANSVSAIIISDGKLYVQHHNKLNQITVPVGKMEVGESPDVALKRELSEELGVKDVELHGMVILEHHDIGVKEHAFTVTLNASPHNAEPTKHLWQDFKTPDEINAYPLEQSHALQHALTFV